MKSKYVSVPTSVCLYVCLFICLYASDLQNSFWKFRGVSGLHEILKFYQYYKWFPIVLIPTKVGIKR